jgi:hypothetical protein
MGTQSTLRLFIFVFWFAPFPLLDFVEVEQQTQHRSFRSFSAIRDAHMLAFSGVVLGSNALFLL